MATITFRCTSCQQVLKIGSDKAGKKAKCTKCGTPLTVPEGNGEKEPATPEAAAPPAAPEAAAPPPAMKTDDEDDDGGMTYGLKDEEKKPEGAEKKEDKKIPAVKGPGRKVKFKKALITDGPVWRKTALGMQIIAGGLCLWVGAFLLSKLPLVAGLVVGPEFAAAADERLVSSPIGSKEIDLDLPTYAYGVICGNSLAGLMLWFARVAQVLYLLMYVVLVAGYVFCLIVPNRFGTKFQVTTLIGLAGVNAFLGLVFKLLPMMGLWQWTIMPLIAPEVAMVEMNQERQETLINFWSPTPTLDTLIAIFVLVVHYFEPVMIAVFIRGCALSMRVPDLDKEAQGLMKLGLGQCFIQGAWILCALCGTSQVLLIVLRVVYGLGVGFFLLQMSMLIVTLFGMPAVVAEQLGDDAFKTDEELRESEKKKKDEEDEEEEDEEADETKDEEEDEDEEDEDDEDDEEDDRDKKKKVVKGKKARKEEAEEEDED